MSQFQSNGDYDDAYDLGEDYDDDAYDLGETSLLSSVRQIPRIAMNLMGKLPTTPYRGSATIDTPAGRANVAMPPDLVSKKEFQALEARVLANNRAILGTSKVVNALGVSTKKLEINAARTRKKFQGLQQGQLFAALLPPKLTEVTLNVEPAGTVIQKGTTSTTAKPTTLEVSSTKFDLMTTLLPMIASGAMGGSTDSGGGSSSMGMMLPLILIMNDKEKGSNEKDDNSTLLLVMMMMMMGK